MSLDPNPFRAGLPFRQTLRLRDGEIEIVAGPADHAVTLRIWVDALRPVVHVEAEGATDLVMRVGLEVWRGEPRELAGIDRYVTHRFLHDVPAELAGETRRQCERLGALLPEVPLHTLADPIRLWPAQRFEQLANSENPELYAVFPYRLYGLGRPGVEIGRATFDARGVKRTGGWSQDPIQAALLGLTDIAAAYTYENFCTKHVTLEVVPERRLKDVVLPET